MSHLQKMIDSGWGDSRKDGAVVSSHHILHKVLGTRIVHFLLCTICVQGVSSQMGLLNNW